MRFVPKLRNLFNQYKQEENRLTHALIHTIARNNKLFAYFVKSAIGKNPFNKKDNVYIGSQGRYGGEFSTDNIIIKERMDSIPDVLIHNDSGTCILIESKVTAPIKEKQLKDHLKQARERGFKNSILLLLTTDKEKPETLISAIERNGQSVHWKGWWEIYGLMNRFGERFLVKDFKEYMEFLETDIINRNVGWDCTSPGSVDTPKS